MALGKLRSAAAFFWIVGGVSVGPSRAEQAVTSPAAPAPIASQRQFAAAIDRYVEYRTRVVLAKAAEGRPELRGDRIVEDRLRFVERDVRLASHAAREVRSILASHPTWRYTSRENPLFDQVLREARRLPTPVMRELLAGISGDLGEQAPSRELVYPQKRPLWNWRDTRQPQLREIRRRAALLDPLLPSDLQHNARFQRAFLQSEAVPLRIVARIFPNRMRTPAEVALYLDRLKVTDLLPNGDKAELVRVLFRMESGNWADATLVNMVLHRLETVHGADRHRLARAKFGMTEVLRLAKFIPRV